MYWYFPFPFESLTSFEKTRYSSNRNIRRSRLCLINFLGSQTWKVSWRITSPRRSILISQPSSIERWRASFAWKNQFYAIWVCDIIRTVWFLFLIINQDVPTFRGTDRHTSRPSLISPNSLSVEQERRSFRSSWYLVIPKFRSYVKSKILFSDWNCFSSIYVSLNFKLEISYIKTNLIGFHMI